MSNSNQSQAAEVDGPVEERRPWVTPAVEEVLIRNAEAGPNVSEDGIFAGS